MPLSLDKLHKYIKLEAERNFDNKAIVGGLDKILRAWEAEARLENLPEGTIQTVRACLEEYPRLDQSQRGEALRNLWHNLKQENGLQGKPDPVGVNQNSNHQSPAQAAPANPPVAEPPLERSQPIPKPAPQRNQLNDEPAIGLNAPLTVISGIGPHNAQILEQLGLRTLEDMLYYFPRRYDDYSKLKTISHLFYGEEVTVIGTVQDINVRPIRNGALKLVEAIVSDGSGSMRLTWFNQPWITNTLHRGSQVVFSGRVEQYLGRLTMNNPEWEPLEQEQLHTNRIVPVYPLTSRITQRWLRRTMYKTVTFWASRVNDHLPRSVVTSAGVVDLQTALKQVHFPDNSEKLRFARERLSFDEIFLLQLGVLRQKRAWQSAAGRAFAVPEDWLQEQVSHLPFQLTGAQTKSLQDLRADLATNHPMNRLLQGDVGSGKTVIAALAILMVAREGCQAAVMAPTSILADQHYRSLTRLYASLKIDGEPILQQEQIALLIGATPEAEKRTIREGLENGTIKLVIGTHALLEDPIQFNDLQLVVVDEQHRFGVEQRATLRSKGTNPHLLVMTATPIPRSLALTVYGDLDLSVMDEMPAGRQAIETHVLSPRERERAYTLIRTQVSEGRQVFVIYPLVEQGDRDEVKAAVEEQQRLQDEVFPKLKVGLLHGRMKPDEKDEVMGRFRDGEYNILVSTSVVEVGVDIPNATVMLIEGANRFGLAQLHQFRGRVGRGSAQSYCLLIPDTDDAIENERLAVMAETNDGFVLAERDLEQRGPGEFLGTQQAGYSELRMANLTDVRLIEKARKEAHHLFELDPDFSLPEHKDLLSVLDKFWSGGKGDIS